jgi:1,4-alpha-glucan branching enzyme
MHETRDGMIVRAFVPWAERVEVLDHGSGEVVTELPKVHQSGFYAGPVKNRKQRFAYRLRGYPRNQPPHEFEDAYRFPGVPSSRKAITSARTKSSARIASKAKA